MSKKEIKSESLNLAEARELIEKNNITPLSVVRVNERVNIIYEETEIICIPPK